MSTSRRTSSTAWRNPNTDNIAHAQATIYGQCAIDAERAVRELAARCLQVVVERDKRLLSPIAREILFSWVGLLCDPVAAIAATSMASFTACFKRDAWPQVCDVFGERILAESRVALSGPSKSAQSLAKDVDGRMAKIFETCHAMAALAFVVANGRKGSALASQADDALAEAMRLHIGDAEEENRYALYRLIVASLERGVQPEGLIEACFSRLLADLSSAASGTVFEILIAARGLSPEQHRAIARAIRAGVCTEMPRTAISRIVSYAKSIDSDTARQELPVALIETTSQFTFMDASRLKTIWAVIFQLLEECFPLRGAAYGATIAMIAPLAFDGRATPAALAEYVIGKAYLLDRDLFTRHMLSMAGAEAGTMPRLAMFIPVLPLELAEEQGIDCILATFRDASDDEQRGLLSRLISGKRMSSTYARQCLLAYAVEGHREAPRDCASIIDGMVALSGDSCEAKVAEQIVAHVNCNYGTRERLSFVKAYLSRMLLENDGCTLQPHAHFVIDNALGSDACKEESLEAHLVIIYAAFNRSTLPTAPQLPLSEQPLVRSLTKEESTSWHAIYKSTLPLAQRIFDDDNSDALATAGAYLFALTMLLTHTDSAQPSHDEQAFEAKHYQLIVATLGKETRLAILSACLKYSPERWAACFAAEGGQHVTKTILAALYSSPALWAHPILAGSGGGLPRAEQANQLCSALHYDTQCCILLECLLAGASIDGGMALIGDIVTLLAFALAAVAEGPLIVEKGEEALGGTATSSATFKGAMQYLLERFPPAQIYQEACESLKRPAASFHGDAATLIDVVRERGQLHWLVVKELLCNAAIDPSALIGAAAVESADYLAMLYCLPHTITPLPRGSMMDLSGRPAALSVLLQSREWDREAIYQVMAALSPPDDRIECMPTLTSSLAWMYCRFLAKAMALNVSGEYWMCNHGDLIGSAITLGLDRLTGATSAEELLPIHQTLSYVTRIAALSLRAEATAPLVRERDLLFWGALQAIARMKGGLPACLGGLVKDLCAIVTALGSKVSVAVGGEEIVEVLLSTPCVAIKLACRRLLMHTLDVTLLKCKVDLLKLSHSMPGVLQIASPNRGGTFEMLVPWTAARAALERSAQIADHMLALDLFLSLAEGSQEERLLVDYYATLFKERIIDSFIEDLALLLGWFSPLDGGAGCASDEGPVDAATSGHRHGPPVNLMQVEFTVIPLDDQMDAIQVGANLLFRTLKLYPSSIRAWCEGLASREKAVNFMRCCTRFMSPLLIERELHRIRNAPTAKGQSLRLRAEHTSTTCTVFANYSVEEFTISITLSIPPEFPLKAVTLTTSDRLGVNEARWRSWMLTVHTLLGRNLSLVDVLREWAANAEKTLEGIEPCAVCYCVMQPADRSLPGPGCATCHNKFHAACLYRWFKTGGQATCPMCRSLM